MGPLKVSQRRVFRDFWCKIFTGQAPCLAPNLTYLHHYKYVLSKHWEDKPSARNISKEWKCSGLMLMKCCEGIAVSEGRNDELSGVIANSEIPWSGMCLPLLCKCMCFTVKTKARFVHYQPMQRCWFNKQRWYIVRFIPPVDSDQDNPQWTYAECWVPSIVYRLLPLCVAVCCCLWQWSWCTVNVCF